VPPAVAIAIAPRWPRHPATGSAPTGHARAACRLPAPGSPAASQGPHRVRGPRAGIRAQRILLRRYGNQQLPRFIRGTFHQQQLRELETRDGEFRRLRHDGTKSRFGTIKHAQLRMLCSQQVLAVHVRRIAFQQRLEHHHRVRIVAVVDGVEGKAEEFVVVEFVVIHGFRNTYEVRVVERCVVQNASHYASPDEL
jgi:hypothetical protein